MEKTKLNNFVMLSWCSTFVFFALSEQTGIIFPRDRIIHIFISALLGVVFIYIAQYINFCKGVCGYIAATVLLARVLLLMYKVVQNFRIFYGSNTFAVLLFTLITAIMTIRLQDDKTGRLYGFFLLFNITLIILMVVLCIDGVNAANIYSNNTDFDFSFSKIYLFFELFALAVLIPEGKRRKSAQKSYLLFSVVFITAVTLLQGLCVKGNIMYSISPLQSMFQIFSSDTVKRFDYYLAIIETVNYFAAVILYVSAVKKCVLKDRRG